MVASVTIERNGTIGWDGMKRTEYFAGLQSLQTLQFTVNSFWVEKIFGLRNGIVRWHSVM